MKWFTENKPDLLIEHPDISAIDLTKIAMRKYKSFVADMKSNTPINSNKRKTMDDENEQGASTSKPQSGIAKLAKFGFTKAA